MISKVGYETKTGNFDTTGVGTWAVALSIHSFGSLMAAARPEHIDPVHAGLHAILDELLHALRIGRLSLLCSQAATGHERARWNRLA